MNETKIFKRKDLYEQVWAKPMIHVSKEYGLSDNGLRKICKKLGIPLPKSGHWSKVLFGKRIEKDPLPDGDYPETYVSTKTAEEPREKRKAVVDPKLQQIMDYENQPENRVCVPDNVRNLHPLVKKTRDYLKRSKHIDKGVLIAGSDCLDVNVSPKVLRRALMMLNSIIVEFAKRKIEVRLKNRNKNRNTSIEIWNERIYFRICEKVAQRELSQNEIEEIRKKDKYFYNSREYKPTGQLTLKIYEDDYYCSQRKEFSDGKEVRLEERLNDFIIYVHSLSLKVKRERDEREEQHRIWEMERQAEEAKKQKIKIENLKVDVLFKLADSWHTARKLRTFIEEVAKTLSPSSELDSWIKWANSKADDIDVVSEDFLLNWKWNVDREKGKHWGLRQFENE